jgi:hypothetical protein
LESTAARSRSSRPWSPGIAGITSSSPALSISTQTGRLVFSVFEDDGHSIYTLDEAKIIQRVPPPANQHAALLPGREVQGGDLYRLLSDPARGLPPADGTPAPERYAGGLKLDAIGQPTVTAGVSGWGSYVSGGMSAFFSDMLGDRMLGVSVQAGGTPSDIGGQLMYVNRQHRWNWAGSIEALPYRVGSMVVQQNPASPADPAHGCPRPAEQSWRVRHRDVPIQCLDAISK